MAISAAAPGPERPAAGPPARSPGAGLPRAADPPPRSPGAGLPRSTALAALALGITALVVEHLVRGNGYWDYSEGVYLLSSRLLLHGGDLYGSIVAAQPPPLFAVGAGLLSIDDSLGWVRWVVGAMEVGTGLLAA